MPVLDRNNCGLHVPKHFGETQRTNIARLIALWRNSADTKLVSALGPVPGKLSAAAAIHVGFAAAITPRQ